MENRILKIFSPSKIIFISTLMLSLIASAYPNVGDKTEFKGTSSKRGAATQEFTASREFLAHDPTSGNWTVKEELVSGTTTWTKTSETKVAYTHDDFVNILKSCIAEGGTLETITLPFGYLDTCMLRADDIDMPLFDQFKDDPNDRKGTLYVWFGDVPSGIVKSHYRTHNGSNHIMELTKVTLGPEPTPPTPPQQPPAQPPTQPPQIPEEPGNPPPQVPEIPEQPPQFPPPQTPEIPGDPQSVPEIPGDQPMVPEIPTQPAGPEYPQDPQ